MYCLQRLIEISHYNISTRIRIEWNQIWQTIGPHFNQVGCHSNPNVVYFCLDKLRQLASKFLELEELANFKFQKEFLKPFLFIFENNPDSKIKDMVLVCINHMIQYKPVKIKSGWKAIFSVLKVAASENSEAIVKLGFKVTNSVHSEFLDLVYAQGFYPDLVATLTAYCHCVKYPKINAQAVAILKQGVEKVSLRQNAEHGGTKEDIEANEDEDGKLWMITLRNMKNVILSGELEVRSKALSDLFDLLFNNGTLFKKAFWNEILDEIVYPIFEDLKKDPQKRENREDTAIWLSTTLVSALKLLVDLYTTFQILIQISLDRLLDLIMLCVVQENDTLSRLGAKCIQEFVERNVEYFSSEVWDKICARIVDLFEVTMPKELWFELEDDTLRQPPFGISFSAKPSKKDFPKIVMKCVLHLNAIQTLHRMLSSPKKDVIFGSIERRHIFTLGDLLYKSYSFAKMFNEDMGLRNALMKMGFMKTLPNLVKQETASATAYLHLLVEVFQSAGPHSTLLIAEIEKRLIP
jgi:brefeldin A-inhibited guanine nucleotide-exchange protein